MLLSIIIPVYNVEPYIERCLNSVFHQDLPSSDFEVIIIDDGTPDKSIQIAERITQNIPNVKILHQENQGLSMARNNGLKQAQGKYVWFIDSDDWIESNCLSAISKKLINDLDLLQLQFKYTYDDPSLNRTEPFCDISQTICGKDQLIHEMVPTAAQLTIYRRDFLKKHKLEFYPGIYHEDSDFKPRALYLAKSIRSYNQVVYNYYQRQTGSIMSQFRVKNGMDILFVNQRLLQFCNDYHISGIYLKAFYKLIGRNMNTILFGIRQLTSNDYCEMVNAVAKRKDLFEIMYQSGQPKYVIESILFRFNMKLGLWAHRLMK